MASALVTRPARRHNIRLGRLTPTRNGEQVIHRQLGFREMAATVVAFSGSNLLFPPLRLAEFPRLEPLALDLLGIDWLKWHPALIGHEAEFSSSLPGRPAESRVLPFAGGSATQSLILSSHFSSEVVAMKPSQMQERLETAYPGAKIQVVDLTGTEDHYQVVVVHPVFQGLSRIEQHQHVMKVFADELRTGEVHALTIKTATPPN